MIISQLRSRLEKTITASQNGLTWLCRTAGSISQKNLLVQIRPFSTMRLVLLFLLAASRRRALSLSTGAQAAHFASVAQRSFTRLRPLIVWLVLVALAVAWLKTANYLTLATPVRIFRLAASQSRILLHQPLIRHRLSHELLHDALVMQQNVRPRDAGQKGISN